MKRGKKTGKGPTSTRIVSARRQSPRACRTTPDGIIIRPQRARTVISARDVSKPAVRRGICVVFFFSLSSFSPSHTLRPSDECSTTAAPHCPVALSQHRRRRQPRPYGFAVTVRDSSGPIATFLSSCPLPSRRVSFIIIIFFPFLFFPVFHLRAAAAVGLSLTRSRARRPSVVCYCCCIIYLYCNIIII